MITAALEIVKHDGNGSYVNVNITWRLFLGLMIVTGQREHVSLNVVKLGSALLIKISIKEQFSDFRVWMRWK